MRTLVDARDPYAVLLAVLVAFGLLIAQEGPLVALLAAASVPIARVGAGVALQRWRREPPTPEAAPGVPVAPPGQLWYLPLTRRESEVALLVADGLTNRQIAEILPSERTVDGHLTERGIDSHVQHIMNKLSVSLGKDVSRRTQITAWVVERRPRGGATKPQ